MVINFFLFLASGFGFDTSRPPPPLPANKQPKEIQIAATYLASIGPTVLNRQFFFVDVVDGMLAKRPYINIFVTFFNGSLHYQL